MLWPLSKCGRLLHCCHCTFSICLALFVFLFTFWSASSLSLHLCSYVFFVCVHNHSQHKISLKAFTSFRFYFRLLSYSMTATSSFKILMVLNAAPVVCFPHRPSQLPPPKRKSGEGISFSLLSKHNWKPSDMAYKGSSVSLYKNTSGFSLTSACNWKKQYLSFSCTDTNSSLFTHIHCFLEL